MFLEQHTKKYYNKNHILIYNFTAPRVKYTMCTPSIGLGNMLLRMENACALPLQTSTDVRLN